MRMVSDISRSLGVGALTVLTMDLQESAPTMIGDGGRRGEWHPPKCVSIMFELFVS
jgi:hypothetical protein